MSPQPRAAALLAQLSLLFFVQQQRNTSAVSFGQRFYCNSGPEQSTFLETSQYCSLHGLYPTSPRQQHLSWLSGDIKHPSPLPFSTPPAAAAIHLHLTQRAAVRCGCPADALSVPRSMWQNIAQPPTGTVAPDPRVIRFHSFMQIQLPEAIPLLQNSHLHACKFRAR